MNALQTVERPRTASGSFAILNAPADSRSATWVATIARPTAGRQSPSRAPCAHEPRCPDGNAVDRYAARVVVTYPEQGWSLLCNGVIAFDDTGALLPDGTAIAPDRGPAPHAVTAG